MATTYQITDDQIETLRIEAGAAGDSAQVAICQRALDGDDTARAECARVIEDAAAQIDAIQIRYGNGRHAATAATEAEAREIIAGDYPDAAYSDWQDDGETTERRIVWASEDDANDDDGGRAIASIYRAR